MRVVGDVVAKLLMVLLLVGAVELVTPDEHHINKTALLLCRQPQL